MILHRSGWRSLLAAALLAGCPLLAIPAAAVEEPDAAVDEPDAAVDEAETPGDEAGAAVPDLEAVVEERVDANRAGAEIQERIDELADATDQMTTEYRGLLKQIAAVRVYNAQVVDLIASQQVETTSLQAQIDDVEQVSRQITPLMLAMIETLANFVELDVPFLPDERSARIADLQQMMTRADVTDSERFRRILEAYQIENEYGRTMEAYAGEIAADGKTRTVDYLRVGRILLIYQSRDRSEMGVWNQETRAWEPLDGSYRSAVRQGLQMARKQAAPDLLRLPVPTARATQ